MRILIATMFLVCIFRQAHTQVRPSGIFADHMVLQRGQDIPVWGQAAKKTKIKVTIDGQAVNATADEKGTWKAILKPMTAGGPYVMTISSGKERLVYHDVMVGEVWICSGQSNMEFQLKNALGYKFEQKNSSGQAIRQFRVEDKMSLQPETELKEGNWVKADSNTVGDFTAVGYFFAKQLSKQLNVTIGLIYSNWGGTLAEDWISRDAMLNSPELGEAAKNIPDSWDGVKQRIDKQLKEWAYNKKPVTNYSVEQLAGQPAAFFDDWQKGSAPASWEWTGKLYSYRGEGFMQHRIKLDSSYIGRHSVLSLGQTDADMELYINGKLIKKGALSGNFQLELPVGTWKPGDNSVLLNLQSRQKNPAWFGMGLTGNSNDLFIRFADTTINLADNAWRVMPDLSKPYHFDFLPNNTAFSLYNAMINPLIPYAFAGVIWYQGESNADRAFQYRTTFPLLINDWRNKWKRDFPFLFVQLSSFGGMQNSNTGSTWAELREAQTTTLQLPNTGMVVTTDIGDALNIHPRDKADVGLRLAGKALTMVYHLPGFPESPLYNSVDFSAGDAIVSFKNASNGLMARDKYGYIKGFELAGADHKFYYAQASIIDGSKVKVWCSQVSQPVAVRYAWTDAPIEANLYSTEGFPVGPFRSDNWKGITEGKKFE
ncbi:sialate O-acetylesterase [Mucilaginibacter sp.]|uniref:sialate O-acetylesterase n=1 Tax=Mucilaginibacter sp. TaxID=1882438 RepID=UPI00284F3855|nr:sialate O-acetylesterase [Mucilaginibacter sp.]MDR3694165.1 sialate O-acetylesterase [Mucilaginibacter sp.]